MNADTTTLSMKDTSTITELEERVAATEKEEKQQAEVQQLLLATVKGVVSMNSFFTGIVFIGLSFTFKANMPSGEEVNCTADDSVKERVVQFEVVAFSSFLFSTLVAQGLKLQMTLLALKHSDRPHIMKPITTPQMQACLPQTLFPKSSNTNHINPTLLHCGMLMSILGSIVGTIFLMLSIFNIIQVRLGIFLCPGSKSTLALYPLLTLVPVGAFSFLSPVLYAVFTFKLAPPSPTK
eukprot:c24425_g1_i1 orf=242-952(+)